MNDMAYNNPRYDELLRPGGPGGGPGRRGWRCWRRRSAIMLDDMPILPIYFYVTQARW